MKDEEYAGYCCLVIAILCNLNADEAEKMYRYGPDHPLCRKILSRKVWMAGLEKLDRKKSSEVMEELLSQGYSVDAVSEAFHCFPSTVRRRVRARKEKGEEGDDGKALSDGQKRRQAHAGCVRQIGCVSCLAQTGMTKYFKEQEDTNGKPETDRGNLHGIPKSLHRKTAGGNLSPV